MESLKTEAEFYDVTSRDKVVVEFFADWCSDCKRVEPHLDEWKEKYAGSFSIVRVNSDELPDVAEKLDVMGIPSFIAFENGQEVNRLYSRDAKSKGQVETFLDQAYTANIK